MARPVKNREALVRNFVLATARAQSGLWIGKLEEWEAERPGRTVRLMRECGVWYVTTTDADRTELSARHASITVAVSQILRQMLTALPKNR